MDEQALIENLRKGDPAAFDHIYNNYWQQLFLQAFHKTGDRQVAEDIVQQIFEQLWQKRASLSIIHLNNYLSTAVKYKVINHHRALLNKDLYDNFVRNIPEASQVATTHAAEAREMSYLVEETLQYLPERTREIFKLSREEKLTNRQISTSLRITEKAVEYHITRSLRELRSRLKEFLAMF